MWPSTSTAYLPRLAVVATLGALLLAGCSSQPAGDGDRDGGYVTPRPIDPNSIPDAVPRVEPRSRYGNPSSYTVFGRTYRVMAHSVGHVERGVASWYGPKFHGKRTSSGEPYDMYQMTAAHKHLPLPTYLHVTNLENGRSVVVRVNDRGPFAHDRILDLSYSAAVKLDMVRKGTARVEIRAIDPRRPVHTPPPRRAPDSRLAATGAATGSGDIYLQAGAFSSEANALLLHNRLQDAIRDPVPVATTPAPGRLLYRVRLGPLDSVETAIRLAAQLDELGVTGARVIID